MSKWQLFLFDIGYWIAEGVIEALRTHGWEATR